MVNIFVMSDFTENHFAKTCAESVVGSGSDLYGVLGNVMPLQTSTPPRSECWCCVAHTSRGTCPNPPGLGRRADAMNTLSLIENA